MLASRNQKGCASPYGFTMVELCVVIAMTGILTALLLPALSTAKEQSRRAVCKNNIRQAYVGMENYANENDDRLPSSGDNRGYYHSIQLSDETFTNFVAADLANKPDVLYCPNVTYPTIPLHNDDGYVIGYSYLAGFLESSPKGPDEWSSPFPTKLPSGSSTNELLADANYWTISPPASAMAMAPHTASGGLTIAAAAVTMSRVPSSSAGVSGSSNATPGIVTSSQIGAVGGNIGYMDGHVQWKPMKAMSTYQASSQGDAWANW